MTKQKFVPVSAIGASAGGVAAFQELLRQLPSNLGLAYVVIVHLSPDQPSALSEILSVCTRMPVLRIQDGRTLKPDCVYVIPPDREPVIEGDSVAARAFSEPRGRRAPIDMFFRSVAAGRGDGVAVVLSGAGSDGSVGVRAVKEAGGVIMVQEPAEARLPVHAAERDCYWRRRLRRPPRAPCRAPGRSRPQQGSGPFARYGRQRQRPPAHRGVSAGPYGP